MSEAENTKAGAIDYGSKEANEFAISTVLQINNDLEAREQESLVFNGLKYSQAYEYNQRKGINYAPPRKKVDDREVSVGLVHEKIVSFVAIFLKYVYKNHITVYQDGEMIPRMGDVYELGIEFSNKLDVMQRKIALIYWETFTQGDCWVLEDWQVRNLTRPKAMIDGEELSPSEMDYTYEFMESLTYEDGEEYQERKATAIIMDGRQVILGDPEIDTGVQDQPRITIEEKMSRSDAEAMFGSLTMWDKVPSDREEMAALGLEEANTLFDATRLENADKEVLVHTYMDKENNRYNKFVNGVMMLPYNTPFTIYYPRNNYPVSQFSAERVTGSAYSRSVPAKTKFNADFLDWALKKLALKFEQGIEPAILAKGKYTLTRDMFRAGNVTHGVSSEDFERADPDNQGVTNADFNFFGMLKDIVESQTINQTSSGQVEGDATATGISIADANQQKKLAFLLDAMVNGFFDMSMRRCETIESKFTRANGVTLVDGKERKVYQDFSISVAGVQNIVAFDEALQDEDYDVESKRNELFQKSHKSRKNGNPTEYYLVDPDVIRRGELVLVVEVRPEIIKDSQIQMIQMFDEFNQLLSLFGRSDQGGTMNMEEVQKEYLQVSGRSEDFFVSADLAQDPELAAALQGGGAAYDKGSFGKPKVNDAVRNNAVGAQTI